MNWSGRHVGLISLFAIQAFCALFFLGDTIGDMLGLEQATTVKDSDTFEYVVALALAIGVGFSGMEVRKILGRHKRMSDQLKVASGAFSEFLDEQFNAWQLTTSERDIALLAIKGFSISDMARVRDTKEGTIKAQCNAVYRKAGVSGRPQLLSLFIEELLSDDMIKRSRSGE